MYDRMDTLLVENDKFSKTVSLDTLIAARLLFSDGTQYPFFMDEGNKIQIKGSAAELNSLEISGNTPNEEFSAFQKELKGLGTPSEKVLEDKAGKFINEHHSSLVSIYLLDKYFVQKEKPDYAQIKKLTEHMTGELKDRPYIDELLNHIQEEEKAAIGKTAPYFRIPNPKGKQINRSNFKDQYLLIHFWASWDTVSRDSNAVYRRIYKQERKNKKFALLGVSLDMNKDTWQKAIKADTLEWEQVCDFSGWNAEIVKQLAIKTLPANILLNPFGKIEGTEDVEVEGGYPAGNAGMIAANIAPVNKGEIIWTLDAQALGRIGRIVRTGRPQWLAVIALTGPEVDHPTLLLAPAGSAVAPLLAGRLKASEHHVRIVSGNLLTGSAVGTDGYLHFPYRQLTVIADGDDRDEFMGWASFSPSKMSESRTFPGHFLSRAFTPDARLLGGRRAMIMSGEYDRYMPADILPEYLLKAIIARDIDGMERLGIYEVAPEDFAAAEYADTSKMPLQQIVREGLDFLRKELE